MMKLLFFLLVLPPSFCSYCSGVGNRGSTDRNGNTIVYGSEREARRAAYRDANAETSYGPFLTTKSRGSTVYKNLFYKLKDNKYYECTSFNGARKPPTRHDIIAIQAHTKFDPTKICEVGRGRGRMCILDHPVWRDRDGNLDCEYRRHIHVRAVEGDANDPKISDTANVPNCLDHYYFEGR